MHYAQVNKPLEIALEAERPLAGPGDRVEVDCTVHAPDGDSFVVPAFWAGGERFAVRIAFPAPGQYRFDTRASVADPGLAGRTDGIEVRAYEGTAELYRRGRLAVDASTQRLHHADGAPFLWLADTWWMGLCTRLDWPQGFRRLAADRAAKGFSAVQIVAGPLPDFDAASAAWHPQQANEGGFPWQPDWEELNPAYYDQADLKLEYLIEAGLVPCIVGMWGYYLPFMGRERARRHWRNLVARYGAYPVVWCIAGETSMPTYSRHGDAAAKASDAAEQREGWSEVAAYVKELDPYHNPITTHSSFGVDSRDELADPASLSLSMMQTGHSGYYSLRSSVEQLARDVRKQPSMPVFNSEACYEGIMGGSGPEIQRFLFWTSMLGGACGHTYGAQGMWAMSSREEPFEGTTASWGAGFWQDVMHYPGSSHVGKGRRFLLRYPWWKLCPRAEPTLPDDRVASYAAEIPGELVLVYLPVLCVAPELLGMRAGMSVAPIRLDPSIPFRAFYFDPRTGEESPLGAVRAGNDGSWIPPRCPSMEDWVLAIENPAARSAKP